MTLIVRGPGGAVWEVDDSDIIRDHIRSGMLELVAEQERIHPQKTERAGKQPRRRRMTTPTPPTTEQRERVG